VQVDTNAAEDAVFDGLCRALADDRGCALTVERARLDLGDVSIKYTDGAGRTHTLLIERKTVPDDWAASISKGGRYKEQKARWMAVQEREAGDAKRAASTRFVYLLEGPRVTPMSGTTRANNAGMNNAAIKAAMIKTALRDHIPVLLSVDVADTALVCAYIARTFVRGELDTVASLRKRSEVCLGLDASAHARKRSNLDDRESITAAMLACIPGVSVVKARAIVKVHGSTAQLLEANVADLASVRCNERNIGPVLARRIKHAVGGSVDEGDEDDDESDEEDDEEDDEDDDDDDGDGDGDEDNDHD
jgi:ERCC4-type nuclease